MSAPHRGWDTAVRTPADARRCWNFVAGAQIAAITNSVSMTRIDGGTLYVGVQTWPWIQELRLMESQMRAAMPTEICGLPLRQIRFRFAPKREKPSLPVTPNVA